MQKPEPAAATAPTLLTKLTEEAERYERIRNRRNSLNTSIELAIRDAQQMVENMGADERLTAAGAFLGEARRMIADYLDGVDGPIPMITVAAAEADARPYIPADSIDPRQRQETTPMQTKVPDMTDQTPAAAPNKGTVRLIVEVRHELNRAGGGGLATNDRIEIEREGTIEPLDLLGAIPKLVDALWTK